jgi:nicotinamide riboside kinase
MTAIWADILIGTRPADLDRVEDPADLYLLCDVDVPFAPDRIRYFPDPAARAKMFAQCRTELETRKLAFVTIQGSHEQRLAEAVKAITERFPELSAA